MMIDSASGYPYGGDGFGSIIVWIIIIWIILILLRGVFRPIAY